MCLVDEIGTAVGLVHRDYASLDVSAMLVRAREDVRGDLMRARHRLSKLLLRQGIVWAGGGRGRAATTCGCGRSGSTCPAGSWRSPPPSGATRSQGSITKTGNGHARRLLVEAAWQHRKTYRCPGQIMRTRWELAPAAARARGHQGNQRLHQRWEAFTARRKKPAVANVAIARELAGWAWSLAVMD